MDRRAVQKIILWLDERHREIAGRSDTCPYRLDHNNFSDKIFRIKISFDSSTGIAGMDETSNTVVKMNKGMTFRVIVYIAAFLLVLLLCYLFIIKGKEIAFNILGQIK
jgi:hypothetical protein